MKKGLVGAMYTKMYTKIFPYTFGESVYSVYTT